MGSTCRGSMSQRRDSVFPDVRKQWRFRPDTLSSVLRDWRQFLWSLTEYKDTAHTLISSQGRETVMLRLRQVDNVFSGTSGQNFQNKKKMQLPQKSLVTCYITLHGTIIKRNNSFSKPSLITWCSIMRYGILNWVTWILFSFDRELERECVSVLHTVFYNSIWIFFISLDCHIWCLNKTFVFLSNIYFELSALYLLHFSALDI